MKFLLFSLLSVLLFTAPYAAGATVKKPLSEVLPFLFAIKGDAIELGNGPTDVYAFIDPRCPHSRDFVGMITESDKMQRRYHYYFFLYAHPMFKSGAVINAIYNAPRPKEAMLDYMLRRSALPKLNRLTPPAIHVKVTRIRKAAEQIGVDKRPYLILDKKKQP
ncbi:hypothetical protein WCX72_01710 [Sulfurimonas sp. HSL1-6]|uniref:hypothetical protein n=1 Tax=Thiomicrolovo immobilis TaxID=3131935 RepID=UPI0031F79072